MIIHPLSSIEHVSTFAQICGRNKHTQDISEYLHRLIEVGSTRLEWCFLLEENNVFIGTIAFWTLPSIGKPLDIVLLELPWEREDVLALGSELIKQVLHLLSQQYELQNIGHVIDTPAIAPQWQHFPEQRLAVMEQLGFQQPRATRRFLWDATQAQLPVLPSRLHYRSLNEVGEAAFIDAIQYVSEQTFDQQIREEREQHGPEKQAQDFFADAKQVESDPSWWELAYTEQGELVGLIMPAKNPTSATIWYIGVVPQFRGKGYVNDLLARGTHTLYEAGCRIIRADTDLTNFPMAQAFERAHYRQFTTRKELSLRVGRK